MSDIKWRKARASGGQGGNCVEVGQDVTAAVVGVRDSKSRERGHLVVTVEAWQRFVTGIRAGRLEGRLAQRQ